MEKNETINCNVVRDLLPLYADDVLSADSAAIVDAHLPECPPCTTELEALRKPVPEKKKNARQSLKTTRRRLVTILAAAMLLVLAVMFVGFRVIPSSEYSEPIAYYDGLFEPIFAFHSTADTLVGEGDFLKVQLARHPRFEYNGVGEITAEDVVTIEGERVGVMYIQVMKDPLRAKASENKANKNGGKNPMIVSYGYSYIKLLPMSEAEKAAFRAWDISATGSALAVEDESQFANWARDIPITRLYYYGGPEKNLLNEALGWSERNGVLENSVLLWDAQTGAWREDYRDYPKTTMPGETTTAIPD